MTDLTPLEVVELEEQFDEELLCDCEPSSHTEACAIIATHRLRATCGVSDVHLACRVIVEMVRELAHLVPCTGCGRPCSVCWSVIPL